MDARQLPKAARRTGRLGNTAALKTQSIEQIRGPNVVIKAESRSVEQSKTVTTVALQVCFALGTFTMTTF